ncbi:MAG TPA: T9SS type A sorting domain-containing protein, partial [Ferruginibacter sp.]|nr:T9SS type A sorting domain-containing protein [Ferruginibacter sp.]
TITLAASASARLLNIVSGGILNHPSSYTFTVKGDPSDVDFKISGTYEIYGVQPTLTNSATVEVSSGGMVKVNDNAAGFGDDFARNTNVSYLTGSIFNWNTSNGFENSGETYFPNATAGIIPIFRISVAGSATGTSITINGILEVNAAYTFSGSGNKIFRDGIQGSSTLTQSSGTINITGTTAVFGGTLNVVLSNAMNITNGITVPAGADVKVSGATLNKTAGSFLVNGTIDVTTCGITNTSGDVTITATGTLKTASTGGLYGSSATIASGSSLAPVLNTGSTIEYNAAIDQAVQGSNIPAYTNIILSNAGTKNLASTNSIASGTVTVKDAAIFNISSHVFGTGATNLVMSGTSGLIVGGSGVKPDMGAAYTIGVGTTIEFNGTSATQARIASPAPNYYNVVISGTNVTTSSLTIGMNFQAGGSFTVNNGAIFKVTNTTGLAGGANTSITNVNGGPTVTFASGSTIDYWGAAQTITNTSTYHHMTLSGSGNKLAPAATLTVQGHLVQSGTAAFMHNNGNVVLNGTAQNFAGLPFYSLDISGGTKTTTGNSSIADYLKINSGATLTIANDNTITILSTLTKTASVKAIDGSINYGNSGSKFIVERFIKTPRKWQLLSVPTNSTQKFRDAWQENFATITNYGMHITDSNALTWAGNGFDALSTGPTIKTYQSASDTWLGILNTTSLGIKSDYGYMTFVRGDRAIANPTSTSSTTILRTAGQLYLGDKAITVPAGFSHVGNPFASAVNLYNVTKSGSIATDIYVWDPLLAGSFGVGKYQTLAINAGGYYDVVPGGGGSYPATWNSIESGQAFFIRTNVGGGTVTFKESDKIAASNMVFFTPGAEQNVRVNLFINNSGRYELLDGIMAKYDDKFSNEVNFEDAPKFINSGENVAISRDNKLLSVERRKLVAVNDTLFLHITGLGIKTYQLYIPMNNMDAPGRKGYLYDKYLDAYIGLNLDGINTMEFTVENIPASYAADRFMIVFSKKHINTKFTSLETTGLTSVNPVKQGELYPLNNGKGVGVYPNPVENRTIQLQFDNLRGILKIDLLNSGGQLVLTKTFNVKETRELKSIAIGNIPAGTYQLVITSSDGYSKKLFILVK